MTQTPIRRFMNELDEVPLIDVRSPGEFADGHVIGAINLPLFSDAERAEVGTLYKQVGKESAIERGLEIVHPKRAYFASQAEAIGRELRVHCWRGGMRSQGMAEFLEEHGHSCHVLEGGYKRFRRSILDFFEQALDLRVLIGHTGSMKTEVLHALRDMGEQVIDLEGAANHEGSSFGNSKCTGQPSTEQFHNLVYEQARKFDTSKRIWIEDESYVIGKVFNIDPLFKLKERSKHILIEVPKNKRIEHLVKSYGPLATKKLIQGCEGIRAKLGGLRCDKAIAHIELGEFAEAADITLEYYDKMYQRSVDKKKELIVESFEFRDENPQQIAGKIYGAR